MEVNDYDYLCAHLAKPIRENSNDILVKYADDKCLTRLISNNDETAYREEIGKLSTWCNANYLDLNTKKTKENCGLQKEKQTSPPLVLQNKNMERVTSYKYLRVTITEHLDRADGTALVHE